MQSPERVLKMKIIIADDSDKQRIFLQNLLCENNFELVLCDNGTEAWEKISTNPDAQLFILDYHMRGYNALELCAKIREHEKHKSKPILILSSENSRELRAKGKAFGAMWLVKPMNPDALVNVIKKMQLKFGT